MALLRTIWDVLVAIAECLMHPRSCLPGALWRLGHVIWVCRVPVAGVLAGGYLLIGTEQARDLFADLAVFHDWGFGAWRWAQFLFLVFAWALIVGAEAREALQLDYWVPEWHAGNLSDERRQGLQEKYWYPALWLPRLLSMAVFLVVCLSMWRTRSNLLSAASASGFPEAEQAVSRIWTLLGLTIAVAFLYIVLIWRPRVRGAGNAPTPAGARPRWHDRAPLLAGIDPLLTRIVKSLARTSLKLSRRVLALIGLVRVQSRSGGNNRPAPPRDYYYVVIYLIFVLAIVAVIDPYGLATRYPRLFLVPILIGGAIIWLSEVAAWSMRWSVPLLLLAVIVPAGSVYFTTGFHDVRWFEPHEAAGHTRQISLDDAVDRWKVANKCAAPDARCPRPILIAGAGGASRAAFFTATVVGALIDLGYIEGAPYGDVRSRIFALSTVSGSSLGAVVVRAALHDAARNDPKKPPCKEAGEGGWYGVHRRNAGDTRFDPMTHWRDCFQAILAGDFLSSIFVALAYRDEFPFINPSTGRPIWSDRAVVLEQAWERRYHRFTTDGGVPQACPDEPLKTGSDAHGLCRPFGYHPDLSAVGAWVPLLFVNGTSVSTGRRIVAGDVAMTNGKTFMPLAYDLFDVRKRKTTKQGTSPDVQKDGDIRPDVQRGVDIRLSTAATISARFPVLFPHGVLRTLEDGVIADQVVDGGYFENDGLATIADVANALRTFNLDPVIIRIVNAPSKPVDATINRTRPQPPPPRNQTYFDAFSAILGALVATRSGHEDAYAASLKSTLGENRFYDIGVYAFAGSEGPPAQQPQSNPVCRDEIKSPAEMKEVSMSWWISQPVQAYLDAQLCLPVNWDRLECELRAGRATMGGDCPPTLLIRTPKP